MGAGRWNVWRALAAMQALIHSQRTEIGLRFGRFSRTRISGLFRCRERQACFGWGNRSRCCSKQGLQAGSKGAPAISPDGRWVVYTSSASGRFEIYVMPFSPKKNTTGPKWLVSNRGRTRSRLVPQRPGAVLWRP